MIVRNERANILRCLESVAPYISSWVICDTGSTDCTQEIILDFFRERGISGMLHEFEFQNFSQARNTALDWTREIDCDYVLLMDADMELRADCANPFAALDAPYYRLLQRGSNLSYWNTRLIRRGHRAEYKGVTHEYLETDVEPSSLSAAWFIDHMSGGSRGNKYERDYELLIKDLERDPNNARTVYYLAQTLKDQGNAIPAANYYEQRAGMGGWDEEAWHAQLMAGRCRGAAEADDPDHVVGLLKAYAMRPWRAEPLLSLATYYRTRGNNELAVMFAKQGMEIPYPSRDILFVESEAYHDGLWQEFAISGFYLDDHRDLANDVCEDLATKRNASESIRNQARWNLQFYAKPLGEIAPSFTPKRLELADSSGLMNPSIVCTDAGRLLTTIRHVNYTIRPDGSYIMNDGETAIKTQNVLAELDPATLDIIGANMIIPPIDYPTPLYDAVLGFEDVRLFTTREDPFLHFIATVRDINAEGIATPIAGVIQPHVTEHDITFRMTDWRILQRTFKAGHEKNWMPVDQGKRLIYSCDPTIVLTHEAEVDTTQDAPGAFDNWRGSSQLIRYMDGWLAIIHEVDRMPGAGERSYQHRFVFFNSDFKITRWSRRFYLQRRGIEFVAGLCWHPWAAYQDDKQLIISWGANRDSEAWVGTISVDDVDSLLMYN
jgi:tetratricopeptide (TPR) repeat protein